MLSIVLCGEIVAQDLSFVSSQSKLRQYALDSIVSGSRSIWGNIQYGDGLITDTSATGTHAEQILADLFSVEFKYRVANSNDAIYGGVWLYDKNGTGIIYGYAQFLPGETPKYSLWLQQVPLPVTDVEWAQLWVLNEAGQTVLRNDLWLDSLGRPMFDPYSAGAQNGLIVIRKKNGEIITVSTKDSSLTIPGTILEPKPGFNLSGHKIMETVPGETNIVSMVALWEEPTIYLDVKSEPSVPVFFDVLALNYENGNTEYERPVRMIWKSIADGIEYTIDLDPQGPSLIELPSGPCRVRFEFKKFGIKPTLWVPECPLGYICSGGGKG
jgi:hypothetical protein